MTRFIVLLLVTATALGQEAPTTPDGFPLPAGALRRFGNRQLRHPTGISNVVVSPDGKLLATGSFHGVVVWDLATLTVKRSFPQVRLGYSAQQGGGTGLTFLPDSKSLLITVRPPDDAAIQFGAQMELAQVLDIETGKKKFGLSGQQDYSASCWLAAGGKEIVLYANSYMGTTGLRFFDAKSGKELRKVDAPLVGSPPWVGPGGNVLAVHTREGGPAVVLDVATGKQLFALPEAAPHVAFSRDGKLVAWANQEGAVHIHDLPANKEKLTFTHPEKERPGPMLFSADAKTLYLTSNHGRLFRWDLTTNKPGPDFGNRHNFWNLTAIALNPDETVLFSASQDHLVKRWDLKTGKELPLPEGYTTAVSQVVAADGKHVILTDHEGQVDYWDLVTGKRVKQLQKPHEGGIEFLVESPDGKWLAGGRTSQDVRLFDPAAGKVVRDLPLADKGPDWWNDQVQRTAFSPDGSVVYATTAQTGLTAFEVPGGKKLWTVPATGVLLAVDPKGRWLATGGGFDRRQVTWNLHDAKTGAIVARPEVEMTPPVVRGNVVHQTLAYISDLAWLPDGSRMVSAHMDGSVRLWDPDARRDVRRLTADDRATTSACLGVSADGKWLAVGRSSRAVEVWELASGNRVLTFDGHDSGVVRVAFTKDGRGVVSNADLSPILWDLCPKDLPKDGLWEKLADADGAKAYRAQWALIKNPAAAVNLFAEQVKPAELGVKREQFDRWVADLDSPRFRVREAAEKDLTAAGSRVPVAWLRKALADSKSDELRSRLGRVLTARDKHPDPAAWRLSRAVQVLERIGTPAAKELLKAWSDADGSPVGEEAKEALDRLK